MGEKEHKRKLEETSKSVRSHFVVGQKAAVQAGINEFHAGSPCFCRNWSAGGLERHSPARRVSSWQGLVGEKNELPAHEQSVEVQELCWCTSRPSGRDPQHRRGNDVMLALAQVRRALFAFPDLPS